MKWKATTKHVSNPKLGDTKEKVKFAIFPVKIEDKWLWWENYICIYTYKTYYYDYDVVVSEGIFTEKYYTETRSGEGWRRTGRRFINYINVGSIIEPNYNVPIKSPTTFLECIKYLRSNTKGGQFFIDRIPSVLMKDFNLFIMNKTCGTIEGRDVTYDMERYIHQLLTKGCSYPIEWQEDELNSIE